MRFLLNGKEEQYIGADASANEVSGAKSLSLLQYLRGERGITSVKDGCSAEAACGACMVEIDGKPRLACVTHAYA